jgi:2-(1,2-epoxy-1,2-dihydrophenyl)acetyl-CoA isomerase
VSFQNIRYERSDGIVTITINRPAQLNAVSIEAVHEMMEALKRVREDGSARVLVITGAGDRAFCVGADVADMVPRTYLEYERIVRLYLDYIIALRSLDIPVLARINGDAVGGGCCTAMACDLRIASERARFGVGFVKVGLSGADLGATYFLPRLVGYGRASEMLLTGELIDAAEALRIGLVNKVVPHDRLDEATQDLAQGFARGAPLALKLTKRALQANLDRPFLPALEFEDYIQSLCLQTEDYLEGSRAFREKRAPRFQGR